MLQRAYVSRLIVNEELICTRPMRINFLVVEREASGGLPEEESPSCWAGICIYGKYTTFVGVEATSEVPLKVNGSIERGFYPGPSIYRSNYLLSDQPRSAGGWTQ